MEPIKPIKIKKEEKIFELVGDMRNLGFQARKLGEASEILLNMIEDKDCKIFFGLAGAMVPAGMKEIIIDMLKSNVIDVFVVTGANLTHDLIEALGHRHYKGTENVDDIKLNKKKIARIYDVFLKDEVYEDLEDFFEKILPSFPDGMNIKEFLWEIGKNINAEDSILRICYEKKIPIFCPAISDSGIGLMIWDRKVLGKRLIIDAFDDMKEIIDIAWKNKKKGVVYIGGGVPKNFIQQTMQFSGPAYYGIQITTDRPEPGGSSGAPLEEGISWGKMNREGKYVNVFCDATIALPLIWGYVKNYI